MKNLGQSIGAILLFVVFALVAFNNKTPEQISDYLILLAIVAAGFAYFKAKEFFQNRG